MAKVYLALYKGRKSGKGVKVWAARFVDWVIRKATRSPYSHCEIAVKYPAAAWFHCYSASGRDGGVRAKAMTLPSDKWDLIELQPSVADSARRLYQLHHGAGYDWRGALGTLFSWIGHNRRRWFCSEFCARAMQMPSAHSWTPAGLSRFWC